MNLIEKTATDDQVSINLRQAICALAEALGLVGMDEKQHGERVAYMGVECAKVLGWSGERQSDQFHGGLLHDCGVSSTRLHTKLVTELDWQGSEEHCLVGEGLLKGFRPLAHLAPIIRYHHTHWDALKEVGLDEGIALQANLIYLVDRVDALLAQHQIEGRNSPFAEVRETVRELSGYFFSPELVDAFLITSSNEAFWLTLEPLNLAEYIREMGMRGSDVIDDFGDLRNLACIFASIVDAKSRFTYEHSRGVAALTSHISELIGLPPQRIAMLEIAALLHDLGKLGVPDEVLDKQGKLDTAETAIMHRHSYDTHRILHQIRGFEEIADWAGNHHETLLGDGYPFHRHENELSIETRILIIADIFQALAQDRPYRASLPAARIVQILDEMAADGRLDRKLVTLVDDHREACWQVATTTHEGFELAS